MIRVYSIHQDSESAAEDAVGTASRRHSCSGDAVLAIFSGRPAAPLRRARFSGEEPYLLRIPLDLGRSPRLQVALAHYVRHATGGGRPLEAGVPQTDPVPARLLGGQEPAAEAEHRVRVEVGL